jgi:thioredoxin reductase (NADPH)
VNDDERIIGMHFLGPNAGEVMQAFALSMRCGATKAQLDMTVGIHPTTVETFTGMSVYKGSGQSAEAGGC